MPSSLGVRVWAPDDEVSCPCLPSGGAGGGWFSPPMWEVERGGGGATPPSMATNHKIRATTHTKLFSHVDGLNRTVLHKSRSIIGQLHQCAIAKSPLTLLPLNGRSHDRTRILSDNMRKC